MKRRISVLGSTGSIGRQSLEVIESLGCGVAALTANRDVELMEAQARKFHPALVAMYDENAAGDLRVRLADTGIKVAGGMEGLVEAACMAQADTVITAVVGTVGLKPTMAAIKERKRIALANKETLVCAGRLVMEAARDRGAEILPVDSEHSAIFQCLMGNRAGDIKRILLTASGGPFRGKKPHELSGVTREQALAHPNWSMGAKITVDSATLMNKGLEYIEAMHLFGVSPEQIKILVHPQSIIHSMVEYTDNSVIAQLGMPDMRLPIQLALTYPERVSSLTPELDLTKAKALTFEEPDMDTFRCLKLAIESAPRTDAACAVMNAANEAAVGLFLEDKISFDRIYELVSGAVETLGSSCADTIDDILAADMAARQEVSRKA